MKTLPPPSESRFGSQLATAAGSLLKLCAIVFGVALVLYLVAVTWLHHHLSGQAVSISQAAGLPADAERVLQGFLSWLLAIALVPALVALVAESLNPLRASSRLIGRLLLLLGVGLAFSLLPHGLRRARGVDAHGLPVHLESSDPARARWWDAGGQPVLFHSQEPDGTLRFWNRPGVTPDSGLPSLPVTREIRHSWEQQRAAAKAHDRAQAAADARAEDERRTQMIAQANRERQAAEEVQSASSGSSEARSGRTAGRSRCPTTQE